MTAGGPRPGAGAPPGKRHGRYVHGRYCMTEAEREAKRRRKQQNRAGGLSGIEECAPMTAPQVQR
jgi:hypothetical protein